MRDEADVVELENLMSAGEALVDSGEERALEVSELGRQRVRRTHWCRTRRSVNGKSGRLQRR